MGYNIGIRIIDEFLAKSGAMCGSFREAMETVSKVGFKMFLGTVATCTNWATDAQGNATECSLILDDIPFVDYVELPPSLSELRYSNILCGVIKGALEQVRFLTTTSNSRVCVTSWDTRFVPCAS